MDMEVKVPLSAISTDLELAITLGVGEIVNTVGTLTVEVRNGQVEDFRSALAEALREVADSIERASLDEDEGEVPDAAAHE